MYSFFLSLSEENIFISLSFYNKFSRAIDTIHFYLEVLVWLTSMIYELNIEMHQNRLYGVGGVELRLSDCPLDSYLPHRVVSRQQEIEIET